MNTRIDHSELETAYLVDDDLTVRKSIAHALSIRGYRLEAFESAEQFLQQASIRSSECFLFDLSMPGMSGLELQSKLR